MRPPARSPTPAPAGPAPAQAHGESAFLRVPKLSKACAHDARSGFIVRHFAGDVLYAGGGFLEANNDTLASTRWLQQASTPFVAHLFTDRSLQPPQPRRGASFASVGQRFSADLTRLLKTLQAHGTASQRSAFA